MTRNKIKLGVVGPYAAPKLFSALQVAYGLCGSWERILVIGSSHKDSQYQHMGPYGTIYIPSDAPPQRYMELLNLAGTCGKDVVIFSSFSQEWEEGVTRHFSSSYYEELLRAHRSLMRTMNQFPLHVIACLDNRKTLSCQDETGSLRLRLASRTIQQEGIERYFTAVLSVEKKGRATLVKDLTGTLPTEDPFALTVQVGAMLQDWCCGGKPVVPKELQQKIDGCVTLRDLYQLLFEVDMDDESLFLAFSRRRMELEDMPEDKIETEYQLSFLQTIPGGLL